MTVILHGGAGGVQRHRGLCVCPAEVPRTGRHFLVLPGHTYDPQHRDHHPALHDRATLHLLGTYWAIFLPYVFGTPYTIFLIRQFFMNIPQEIIDASKMDGCSEIGTLWTVVVPLSRPVIITATIIAFVFSWNNFLWPLIVTQPVPLCTDHRDSQFPVQLRYVLEPGLGGRHDNAGARSS